MLASHAHKHRFPAPAVKGKGADELPEAIKKRAPAATTVETGYATGCTLCTTAEDNDTMDSKCCKVCANPFKPETEVRFVALVCRSAVTVATGPGGHHQAR